eukprot:TRINITY_DN56445_c2_g1_i1.p1 TRINITY_DN56445_c2_g1~~TRINITY_DN56445_c2_g1_i1.p1  ORF type:complete len:657 (+),score=129.59 TRINITY_DN56445_c2_g1_i1:167-1972(+)
MFCQVCLESKQVNGFTKGSRNFQYSALKEHTESRSHVSSVATVSKQSSMIPHSKTAIADEHACLTGQLRTVLTMSQENIALSKFPALIELQKANGCSALTGETYKHHDTVEEMEACLVDVTKQEIRRKVQNSPFVGLMIDETLNCTLDKKLIMYARVLCDGSVGTVFLGNYTIDNGTAECVFEKVVSVMTEWGITDRQLAGFGSDGASVMTGRLNGVGVRLTGRQPALVHVHCVAHRVALTAKDATTRVVSVSDYRLSLQQVYKLYKASGDRTHRLREMCDTLDDVDYVCLQHPISVRWLSLGRAVSSIRKMYTALVMELEEEAQRKNPAAEGLVRKFKMYSFVAMTYMLSDVIPVIERLNLTFQKDSVNLSVVQPMVESTKDALQHLLTTPGDFEGDFAAGINAGQFQSVHLTHVDRRQTFERARSAFIQELIDSFTARFPPNQISTLSAFAKIFDVERYPQVAELDEYAAAEMAELTRQYAAMMNGPRANQQFNQFKRTLCRYGARTFDTACTAVIRHLSLQFPDFGLLAQIALVIPVSSVPCERGFSVQNKIKTLARNRLSEARVSRLMTLKMESQSFKDFNMDAAKEAFVAMKKRRK